MNTPTIVRVRHITTDHFEGVLMDAVITVVDAQGLTAARHIYHVRESGRTALLYSMPWSSEQGACQDWAHSDTMTILEARGWLREGSVV